MSELTYPIPDAALAAHTAVLGKTGAGKTSTAKSMVEHLVSEGARVCVLDPIKSDWWGLTSSADGKRPGLPFHILGGPRGHVPLHASSGAALAEIVASAALPLSILDMAFFEPGGQSRFFTHFAPVLLRKMRGVLHLVIEEAHMLAPKERSGIGDENMAIHWAKMLATAGRSKGIRLIVATQRTQALHNAVLGSCDTMIAHRLTAPADQKPVNDWLKANVANEVQKEVSDSLSSLKTGTAWVCSGEARLFEKVTFPRIATYDNTATPTGELTETEVRTAPVDLEKLRAIVGDAAKEVEANDPKALKAEIATLKRDLAKATDIRAAHAEPDPVAIKRAEDAAFLRGVEEGERRGSSVGQSIMLARARSALDGLRVDDAPSDGVAAQPTPRPALAPARPKSEPVAASAPRQSEDGVPPGCAKPLASLAGVYPAGMTEAQWATAAGYKRSGGTWGTYKSRLRGAGLIKQRDSRWFATEAGAEAAGDVELPPAPGPDLVRWWASRLPGTTKIAEALIEAWPRELARDELAAAVSMSAAGGSFGTYLSRLASPGIIERDGGVVRLSAEAMGAT